MATATIRMLPVGSLKANDYNPNRMTAEALAELVAEVRHLGRLPKPVVVRPTGSCYLIVDGEHGWRAAEEVGLAEVPCEVIEVDDFEAMRQTYKRNRHGNDDALQLGRMFKRMMDAHGLSRRNLAKEIEVSEGTIRNGLMYAEAAELRNSYAQAEVPDEEAETPDEHIARLSVRQVRAYLQLPPTIAKLWVNAGADLRELYRAKSGDEVDELETHHAPSLALRLREYADLEQTGLVEYVRKRVSSWGFARVMKQLRRWAQWERGYLINGLTINDLRPYTRHCFEEAWPVREECLMEQVLELVIDPTTRPPRFRLTPDEFAAAIVDSARRQTDSAEAFRERLRLQIQGKHGRLPDDRGSVRWQLQRAEILETAPTYVRDSRLPVRHQYALWKASLAHSWVDKLLDGEDEETVLRRVEVAKQRLAALQQLQRREDESLEDGVRRLLAEQVQEQRLQEAFENCTEAALARGVAERVPLYDGTRDQDAIERMTVVLAQLTKAELLFFDDCAKFGQWRAGLVAMMRGMAGVEDRQAPPIDPECAG